MDRVALRQEFQELGVWQSGDERAPYKPLLLLWTLARYQRGEDRLIPYDLINTALLPLFRQFGPPRATYHTEYPFWYLQNDGVWEVAADSPMRVREGKAAQPTKKSLLEAHAAGGLKPEHFAGVVGDQRLLRDIALDLLSAHFPESLHEEIAAAVGLDVSEVPAPRPRDPRFRQDVLLLYSYRCAVCGFDARLWQDVVGVEAAHIKWHQAGGPGTAINGVALCSLHHKLFDRGAFTLDPERRIEVSLAVNGTASTEEAVIRFHGAKLALPSRLDSAPALEFVNWHRKEVFKAPGRG